MNIKLCILERIVGLFNQAMSELDYISRFRIIQEHGYEQYFIVAHNVETPDRYYGVSVENIDLLIAAAYRSYNTNNSDLVGGWMQLMIGQILNSRIPPERLSSGAKTFDVRTNVSEEEIRFIISSLAIDMIVVSTSFELNDNGIRESFNRLFLDNAELKRAVGIAEQELNYDDLRGFDDSSPKKTE